MRRRVLSVLTVLSGSGALLLGVTALAGTTTAAAADSPTSTLAAGHQLTAHTSTDALTSPSGEFALTVYSGIVELDQTVPFGEPGNSYSTGTWFRDDPKGTNYPDQDRTTLRLQRNGNLVLRVASGKTLWSSHTRDSGATGLRLTNGGNLLLQTARGRTVWSSRSGRVVLAAGSTLPSGARLVDAWNTALGWRRGLLTMQSNGNLVHRCGSKVLWQTRTHRAGSRLVVTRTADLRVVGPAGRVLWSSRSGAHSTATVLSVRGLSLEQFQPRHRFVWHPTEPASDCS